jgi:hypothetical protein
MLCDRTVWFTFNEGSGSNSAEAHLALTEAFDSVGCRLHRRVCFPGEDAPDAATLASHDVDVLVIFAGDGTIHSIMRGLVGWNGAVLVLPGGTMNLLARRLHGEADAAEIIARVGAQRARTVRPTTILSRHGIALTGMLAGPGTAWNPVREAMRESDIIGTVARAGEAIGKSTGDPAVICRSPVIGRQEGYAAMMLTPHEGGIELNGFYADTFADYLRQGWALLRRDFREGPHEMFCTAHRLTVASTAATPIGLLIDGETASNTASEEQFELGRCEVDLLATIATDVD